MADGSIKILIEVDGKQIEIASKELDRLGKAGQDSGKGVKDTEDSLKNVGKESNRASENIKKIATSLGLVAIGAVAFKVLRVSLDDAINRFDTLNKFPKVLQSLGVSAEDSERAMRKLADGIDGLPTKLDYIAQVAQRMYTSFNDMDKAADSALALNNALLGSGASAEQASRGTEMYLKMLQTGKVDMTLWRTLSETMDVGLIKIAESMGFVGKTAKEDLYRALQTGERSLDEFNDALIEVGTGSGIMAKLARENTLGLATSWENLKTAVVRGLVEVIDSFNRLSKAITGKEIAQNIDSLKGIVFSSFKVIARIIDSSTPVVTLFAKGVETTISVVKVLSPAIYGLMAAYGGYVVISKATALIQASNAVLAIATASSKALTISTTAQMTAQIGSTTATQADIVAKAAQGGAINILTLAVGVLTGKITLSTAAQTVATTATYAFGGAIRFLMGPIGWTITAIGVLTAGIIALVKWYKSASEETNRLADETNELLESTEGIAESVNESKNAYQEQQGELEKTAKNSEELINKISELTQLEELSSAQKREAKVYVDQLNESVQGLNLAFDEEAQALNMTSEELENYVKLNKDMEDGIAARERINEITREQMEIESELEEINRLREEWNEKVDESGWQAKTAAAQIYNLNEREAELKETNAELATQYDETQTQIETSINTITDAIKNGVADQIISYESLPPHLKDVVDAMKDTWQDYENYTTDMFNTLSDKIKITASEMADNLEENQRIVGEWANNIATLAERGVDDGLLDKLREAGPESAGHVNALVQASDKELERLNDVFGQGGQLATEALAKSLGIEESGLLDAVGHLVADTESTLKEQISAAGFDKTGMDVAKGLAEGIVEGTSQVAGAAVDMADSTTDAAKDTFGVQSPSTVFKQIGLDLDLGLALGISQGTGKVVEAIQQMFNTVINASTQSFNIITQNYDASISGISTTLNRLPVVTQSAMNNTTSRLESGANTQVSTLDKFSNKLKEHINSIVKDFDLFGTDLDKSFNKLVEITEKSMNMLLQELGNGAKEQIKFMKDHANSLPKQFDGLPSEMQKIGADAMDGFDRGLQSRKSVVMATARDIANSAAQTMRQALDTHSPSRVFMRIGEDTILGYALGIDKRKKDADKTITNLFNSVLKISKDLFKEEQSAIKKNNDEIKKIEQRSVEDINLIKRKALDNKRKLTQAELIRIRRIEEDAAKKIQNLQAKNNKIEKDMAEKQSKELLKVAEKYVEDKKKAGEMSLQDEIYFWNAMYRNAEKGSEQYELGMKNHQAAVKALRQEVESINKEYNDRIIAINKEFNDESKKLHDEYNKDYDDHLNKMLNFAGLFDEFKRNLEVTGQDLIKNLESQNQALADYDEVINQLGGRINDKSLVSELKSLGVKAVGELQALNSLSDVELEKYVMLYQQKFEKAKKHTDEQMKPLLDETNEKLEILKIDTSKRLDEVNKEWQRKIKQIVKGADKEFDSMKQVGIDAMQGLSNGMESMRGPLMAKAQSIASAIQATIASAFDIQSPSRWMRDFIGKNMMLGWIQGIDSERTAVLNKAAQMAEWMKPDVMVENRLRGAKLPINNLIPSTTTTNSTNTVNKYDQSRKQENRIEIHTHDSGAKEMERTLRRLRFGL